VFPERDPCFQTRGNSFLVLFSGLKGYKVRAA